MDRRGVSGCECGLHAWRLSGDRHRLGGNGRRIGVRAASEPPAVAVLDLKLVDTGLKAELAGASDAERARLRRISDLRRARRSQVRAAFA